MDEKPHKQPTISACPTSALASRIFGVGPRDADAPSFLAMAGCALPERLWSPELDGFKDVTP
jgi:hypothetical protein